ncbi:MAG: cytochrome c3 family protein [Holophaga sp.]|nr:cytochrome c3 family protein [Holophaga sp.]
MPAKPAGDCRACHPDFKAVLGATHPVVKAKSIAECLTCHGKPGQVGAENAFSVRIHRAHAAPDSGVACIVCHDFKAGRSFTVKGRKQNLGKPTAADFALCKDIMATLGTAKFMASGHVDKRIGCSGCHGATFPMKGDTVENEACLACHGSYEALAEKSRVKDPKGLNPHKSHLGVIACTVCHFGHQKSVVYCRDCHPKTTLAIPFDN